jgi:hypothetical protein
MPDIQTALRTALTKTLQTWDDDDEGTSVPVVAPVPTPVQPVSSSFSPNSKQRPIMYHIRNNVSRETFNYIKNNPGSTRNEIITALEHKGFSKGSVSSLIAQMRKNKMAHDTGGLWYADVNEYQPIKNVSYIKRKEKKQTKKPYLGELLKQKIEAPKQAEAGIAALRPDTTETTTPKRLVSLVRNRAPQDVLKDMTVYQARELYAHLKELFGG